MKIVIRLNNSGGEIDRRVVSSEEEIQAAVLDIVSGVETYYAGDSITITEED